MCYIESSFPAKANSDRRAISIPPTEPGLNESVAEYIAELRKLALHCEFGEFLKDALRDRLVCVLRNAGVQK